MSTSRIMALFLCLSAGIILQAQDSLLYQRLTITETTGTMEEAIRMVEKQTGLSFSYNTGMIDKRTVVSISSGEYTLIDLLSLLFKDASLHYSVIGRHLVIYRPFKSVSADPERLSDSVSYFLISGKIFDQETRQPVPFSSVYLVGKTVGTISNEEGEFKLKLNTSAMGETLSISSIGYKTFTSAVSALVNTDRNYFLQTDVIPIQEVIIRRLSPVILLQNANNRIEYNYPHDPSILTSFYRETIQRGNHYTMVSEAILKTFKQGYLSPTADRVKILKGRKSEDLTPDDSVMLKLKAGLNTMLMLDVIKNIPDFLTGENLDDYHYRLADMVVEDDRDHYVVEFNPREEAEGVFYSGRIIIDINDMAFKWVEFQVGPKYLGEATGHFIVKKPANMVVKTLNASYKVAFRKLGSKYYLHLIQCETSFRIRNRRQLSGTVYNTKLETVVIDIDTMGVNKFSQRETARPYEFFAEQLGKYDEAFWGEYNFITPDQSLENALNKLKKTVSIQR